MRTVGMAFKLTLSASFLLCQGAPLLSASEDAYRKMADDFTGYSVAHDIKNVTVIGFLREGMTFPEESGYISEKLLAALVASGKVNLLERSQLDKILEERGLSAPGGAGYDGRKIDSSNAIIAGTVFGTGRRLKVIARMIDPLTGAVLHTVEVETVRQFGIMLERLDPGDRVPGLRAEEPVSGEGGTMRPPGPDPCDVRKERLASLQSATLEARAKYWSLRMRDPAFDMKKVTGNPAGELSPAERKKFYDMLRAVHLDPEPPEITGSEMKAVLSVIQEEKSISADCGAEKAAGVF